MIRVARVARDVMSDEMGAWMESWDLGAWMAFMGGSYLRYGTT